MWLNSLCKPQSRTILLIFFLIIAFIAPLYHYHEHPAEYYHHDSDGHYIELDHGAQGITESVSAGHKHVGSHLHLKKDFSGSNANNGLQSKPQRSAVLKSASYVLTCVRVFDSPVYDHQKFRPINSFAEAFSGLSPPAC